MTAIKACALLCSGSSREVEQEISTVSTVLVLALYLGDVSDGVLVACVWCCCLSGGPMMVGERLREKL